MAAIVMATESHSMHIWQPYSSSSKCSLSLHSRHFQKSPQREKMPAGEKNKEQEKG